MPTFADLGVPDDLCDALDARNISEAFPIQAATIPPALEGRDICGRAPTGSGKTFAFGIPMLANIERARPKRPRGLVLVPTRELAAQVADDLAWMGAARGVRVHAFYGGVRFEAQTKALRQGVDIAVACPGRLADLINQNLIRLDGVDRVVIDEADRMADMGFLPEVKRIVDQTDSNRQTWLFSATLDGDVDELIRRYQNDPAREDVTPETPRVELTHHHWLVKHPERISLAASIVARVGPTIIFTRTRHGADRAAKQLEQAGIKAAAIHGNRSQSQRQRALNEFATGHVQTLVATDVAARGIHIDDVACVIHFDMPDDPKDYVHRSGRTGRAGSTGIVVAFVMPDKKRDAKRLERDLKLGATLVEPDLELLPVGAPRPKSPRKTDDRSYQDRSSRAQKSNVRPGKSRKGRTRPNGPRPGGPRNAGPRPGGPRNVDGEKSLSSNSHRPNAPSPRGPKRHSPQREWQRDRSESDSAQPRTQRSETNGQNRKRSEAGFGDAGRSNNGRPKSDRQWPPRDRSQKRSDDERKQTSDQSWDAPRAKKRSGDEKPNGPTSSARKKPKRPNNRPKSGQGSKGSTPQGLKAKPGKRATSKPSQRKRAQSPTR